MSHRDDCPSRREAEREGEKAYERGLGSWRNPYKDGYEDECPEAAKAWQSGYRDAERRREELEAEEAEERRLQQRRSEERDFWED